MRMSKIDIVALMAAQLASHPAETPLWQYGDDDTEGRTSTNSRITEFAMLANGLYDAVSRVVKMADAETKDWAGGARGA